MYQRCQRRSSAAESIHGSERYIVAPGDEFELAQFDMTGTLERLIRVLRQPVPILPEELDQMASGFKELRLPDGTAYPTHGTIDLPDRFRPLQIGEDFILGVTLDELDVERVRIFRLVKD